MNPIRRYDRVSPRLAAFLLIVALWLQVAQPLLLAGHLAACATDPACGGACRHPAGADPAFAVTAADAAAGAPGHDALHCVLCRALQFAGKGLTVETAAACGPGSPAAADRPLFASLPAAGPHLADCGPRAPPSC
jgi:hypothetical protein